MAARWFNVALGAWLIVSGLAAWPDATPFAVHLAAGTGIFLLAFLAMGVERLRLWNAALGAFTAVSPLLFHYVGGRFGVHDMVIGFLVFWAAVTPTRQHHGAPS